MFILGCFFSKAKRVPIFFADDAAREFMVPRPSWKLGFEHRDHPRLRDIGSTKNLSHPSAVTRYFPDGRELKLVFFKFSSEFCLSTRYTVSLDY